jgi:restriction endonuclease
MLIPLSLHDNNYKQNIFHEISYRTECVSFPDITTKHSIYRAYITKTKKRKVKTDSLSFSEATNNSFETHERVYPIINRQKFTFISMSGPLRFNG